MILWALFLVRLGCVGVLIWCLIQGDSGSLLFLDALVILLGLILISFTWDAVNIKKKRWPRFLNYQKLKKGLNDSKS